MAVVPTMADSNRCDTRPIPLECMLCPKRPKFSDVSHLLTHVSSKSHLHNKFNAEFAAKTEPGTKEALRQYDMWYKQYGIEALLAERLAAKDQKRGGGRRGRQPAASVNTTRSRAAASYTEPIKPDPGHGYAAPIPVTPIMAHWGIVGGGGSLHLHEARQDTYFDESVYHTPVKRGRSPYSFVDPIEEAYPVKYASSRSEAETNDSTVPSEASTALTEIPEEEGQNSRLKGTVWPGMALFDSATPEQKRKRNQRKDSSVLEQMKLTSQAVSATECIWTPDGQFQRARDIYASPSIEGSPVATPTRKRKYRPRRRSPAHIETDKSTKNDRSEDQKKKRARRIPLADLTNVRQTRATTRNAGTVRKHGNAKRSDSSAVAKGADMDDVKISVASHDHKDGFDIFRDGPDAAIDRAGSPLDEMQENNRFDIPHRNALQTLTPSLMMASPTPMMKQQPQQQHPTARFYSASLEPSSHLAYRTPSTFASGYLPPQHGMSGNTYNPLCSQPRGGVSYHHYNSPVFDEGKLPTTSFQPINNRLDFSSFGMAQNTNPYANTAQRDTTDFDM